MYSWPRIQMKDIPLAKRFLPKIHPWIRNLGLKSDPWGRHTPTHRVRSTYATVLSLTWESPYPAKTVFILRQGCQCYIHWCYVNNKTFLQGGSLAWFGVYKGHRYYIAISLVVWVELNQASTGWPNIPLSCNNIHFTFLLRPYPM